MMNVPKEKQIHSTFEIHGKKFLHHKMAKLNIRISELRRKLHKKIIETGLYFNINCELNE